MLMQHINKNSLEGRTLNSLIKDENSLDIYIKIINNKVNL